ncbi:peptidylprolyl isomerase [Nibricoccus sp. IMCC34717]|uniref:FKBP-type peptidyl-prolyl cis-trans isomerase n=1 Tax=Nibricoccus sp. IMCC34717 TaxID=3034021 RepID=UPI00384B6C8E
MSSDVVAFHFTLRDAGGRVIDFSVGGEPVRYLEGANQILDGLEEGLRGLAVGQKARIEVPPHRGYGLRDEALVHRVPRSQIPVEGELTVGDRFQTEPDPGAPVVTIAAVSGDEVTIDGNHPLAGVALYFEVEVVGRRAATPEEMAGQGGGCGCGSGCDCKE